MKTTVLQPTGLKRRFFLIDAKSMILGQAATLAARLLRGKDNVLFTPHVDSGDSVVIVNAAEVELTGNKMDDKLYYTHSGVPGKLKSISAQSLKEKGNATKILFLAIKGMLPKNRLQKLMLKRLHIYNGPDHKHEAQQPVPYTS